MKLAAVVAATAAAAAAWYMQFVVVVANIFVSVFVVISSWILMLIHYCVVCVTLNLAFSALTVWMLHHAGRSCGL